MMQNMQKYSNNLSLNLKDLRVRKVLGVLLNLKFQLKGPEEDVKMSSASSGGSLKRKRSAESEWLYLFIIAHFV
ncbi:stress-inducible protein [Perilla frutescens var. hirtella]|uniref:Stress-inducible protein n=1 Tax=Perilla frutescens var. hirtella TaxID=608512 RepID=A0AAD4JHC2_PERFH|nr:stress-inducible protein [Perilla frutescens var. hirtella]